MATICLYQDSRHEKPLFWIRKILRIGYISRRKDGIAELRINGFKQVNNIVGLLLPYIKFKKEQAKFIYSAKNILLRKKTNKLNDNEIKKLIVCLNKIRENNYISGRKIL
jgi:hypothetical protein